MAFCKTMSGSQKILDTSETPGFLRRLGAIVYDTATAIALIFVAHTLVVVSIGTIGGWENFDAAGLGRNPLHIAFLLAMAPLFFLVFWTKGGQTLGMRAWRIRVVRKDGAPLTPGDAAKRLVASLLSWLCLGLGFLWILVDRERIAWHDRLSGTRLVLTGKRG